MLAVTTLLASRARPAHAQVQYYYLGGANSLWHCAQIAGAYGFQYGTYGGYVNGIYYANACFGSNYRYPQPTPGTNPSIDRVDEAASSLDASLLLLRSTLLNSSEFDELRPYAEDLDQDLGYMIDAIDDRASLAVIRRRFEIVRTSFGVMERKYIDLYNTRSDRNVTRAWSRVESAYVNLAELLR